MKNVVVVAWSAFDVMLTSSSFVTIDMTAGEVWRCARCDVLATVINDYHGVGSRNRRFRFILPLH